MNHDCVTTLQVTDAVVRFAGHDDPCRDLLGVQKPKVCVADA